MENKSPNPTDRISGLPPAIIHEHILTSLPEKDVKVMSSLSKTWYHIITSFPYLVFHDSRFVLPCSETNTDMYLNYVTQTLQRFHNHNSKLNLLIRKLDIPITFHPRVAPFLDSWIELALKHGVERLTLEIRRTPLVKRIIKYKPPYELPQAIFASKAIKVLAINGCSLLLQSFPNEIVRGMSSNLRALCLKDVHLDELCLNAIISHCPLLEELVLCHCMGNIQCLRISNLHKLKKLCIFNGVGEYYPIVEIDVPSLTSLTIGGYNAQIEDNLSSSRLIPFLPSLNLWRPNKTKLKVSSHTLNKFTAFRYYNPTKLVSFMHSGEVATNASSKGSLVGQWNISTRYVGSFDTMIKFDDFIVQLHNLVSRMEQVSHLYLSLMEIQSILSFEGIKQRVVQPVANIDHLELCSFYEISETNFFNDFLWCYHPRTLSLQLHHFDQENKNTYVVKHMCKIIIRHRGGRCSCPLARTNWLHRLEDVRYVTEDGTEDRLAMDGTAELYLCSSYKRIKFIFKW